MIRPIASSLAVLLLMATVSCVSHRDASTELAGRLLVLQHDDEIFEFYRSQRTNALASADRETQKRFQEEFTWQRMKPDLITIYTNTYSPSELKAYVDFYSSSAGQVRMERWKQTRDRIGALLEKKATEFGSNRL